MANFPIGKNPYRKIAESQRQAKDSDVTPVHAAPITRTASRRDEIAYDETGAYNPRPLAGFKNNKPVSGTQGRLFDKKGELNAYSKQDAAQQISYLMGHFAPNNPIRKQASMQEREARRRAIQAAVKDRSGEGFALLGEELLLPIKDIVDYEGWCRNIYRVRPLAQGELFRIARDVRATASVIGQDGQTPESRLTGKYILVPEFKIASFVTVDIEELLQMNYDVLDRAQDTARQEIELEEDKRGLYLLDQAARQQNTVSTFGTLGIAALENLRVQVEKHRLVVTKFLVNRQDVSDVFTAMTAAVDPVTQRELLLAGYWGNFYGAKVFTAAGTSVQEVVPLGNVYAVTDPEYLGEMGIRQELFSEPYNKYPLQETVKGWAFCEILGFAIANTLSCAVAERG